MSVPQSFGLYATEQNANFLLREKTFLFFETAKASVIAGNREKSKVE